MAFNIGFSSQISDVQLSTQMNNERRMALTNQATPQNFAATAAEDKQLGMANVLNFANEEAYENMDKRHRYG